METFSTNHNTATHHKDVPTQQQGSLLLETIIHTLGVSSGREGRKGENIYLAILMNHDEMSDVDFFKRLFFLLLIVGAVGQDILQFGGRRKGCPNKYGKQGDGRTHTARERRRRQVTDHLVYPPDVVVRRRRPDIKFYFG